MGDEVTSVCGVSGNISPPFEVTVLVVDDDAYSLKTTLGILTSLKYKAVGCRHPSLALDKLRNHQGYFQLIVMDVHLPDLDDGFKLKQIVDEDFALPIIMISADNNEGVMEKALMSGVLRYILKPPTTIDFKGIWQFAIARMNGKKPINTKKVGDVVEESNGGSKQHKNLSCSSFTQEKRRIKQKSNVEKISMITCEDNGSAAPKKTKVVWKNGLQCQFLEAINVIGLQNAAPKRILEVMNVQGLTRQNVASHLQKYRLFLKQVARTFAMVINNANYDREVLLSNMASTYPSLVLKNIQEEIERNSDQIGRTSNLASSSISKSQLRYIQSKLLSNPSNSRNCFFKKMNPNVEVGTLLAGKINNLGIINTTTKPPHPYPNANDADQNMISASDLLQPYIEPSSKQPISPSGLVSRLGQASSSSNFSNCEAGIELASLQGRVGSSQIQTNGTGVPNAFDYASMNKRNINNVISSEMLKSKSCSLVEGPVFTTDEVYRTSQTSPISIEDINVGNIVGETLCQPNHPHQISNQAYQQSFASTDNNSASYVTSNGSHFEGTDCDVFSMEGNHNNFLKQDTDKGEGLSEDAVSSDCTMHINTTNSEASAQEWDYDFIESILDNMA